MKNKAYVEHRGKVIETSGRFEHVMAITLDPRTNFTEGIARCIVSREGDVSVGGYLDRSELFSIKGNTLDKFELGEKLNIKNEEKVIAELAGKKGECIGLEDPDIWIDEKTNLMHVYFTIPTRQAPGKNLQIHLGHAVGHDIHSLEMTPPVLVDAGGNSAKELSIAPVNSKGFRYNLIESSHKGTMWSYSTVRIAVAHDMGESWQFGDTVFNPEDHDIAWVGGHASPGPLLPKTFIDVGENKLLGILNGREANKKVDGKTKYGMFSVGLFIYDYELGKIEWVSPEPFIIDSEATTITFASQFVETEKGKGILYAHVDDSFVRAYSLDSDEIRAVIPF